MNSFENLIAPISTEAPTGGYLKLDRTEYRAIRNRYNASLSSFRQLIETPETFNDADLVDVNRHNWSTFRDTVEQALCQKTKDLELLSWYITTLAFSNSPLPDLANGFRLLVVYLDTFWDSLHPTLPNSKSNSDTDDNQQKERAEFRIKPLMQFVGDAPDASALFMPAQFIHLVGNINYSNYLHAENSGTLDALKKQASEQFNSSVTDNVLALDSILSELVKVETALNRRCLEANIAPIRLKYVHDIFQTLLQALRILVGDKYDRWPLDAVNSESKDNQPTEGNAASIQQDSTLGASLLNNTVSESLTPNDSVSKVSKSNTQTSPMNALNTPKLNSCEQLKNREQAFRQLGELAEYFRQTEPHSPTSYLLERAIQWGHLSLPELMSVLMGHDPSALNHIDALIGVNDKPIKLTTPSTKRQTNSVAEDMSSTAINANSNSNTDAVGSASAHNESEENQTNTKSEISDFNW